MSGDGEPLLSVTGLDAAVDGFQVSYGVDLGIDDEDAAVEEVYDIFEELSDRRQAKVENLSGGQAKMVSIGRALALKPDLLILDEPLEGLAPVIVERLKEHIRQINDQGIAVLIAESSVQHVPGSSTGST